MSVGRNAAGKPLHIAHVLYSFAVGGLENGLVNLLSRLEPARFRHSIISLADHDPVFAARLDGNNHALYALHKRDGNDFRMWLSMFRLLRELRPDVVHTRNFVALETQWAAQAAGVNTRIHSEHGWDVHDLDGSNRRHQLVRRVFGVGVHHFVALSRQIERYLVESVGIAPRRVTRICNGVDEAKFFPREAGAAAHVVIGSVGRMQEVKNQPALCRAFCMLAARRADLRDHLRLRLVGAGPLLEQCRGIVAAADCAELLECVGDSSTVAAELRGMDVFVLPSRAEGISNTILEAMASGLPVIATAVGGNPELVADGESGVLVGVDDDTAMAAALERYVDDRALRERHGRAGRALVEQHYSLSGMVAAYDRLYHAAPT